MRVALLREHERDVLLLHDRGDLGEPDDVKKAHGRINRSCDGGERRLLSRRANCWSRNTWRRSLWWCWRRCGPLTSRRSGIHLPGSAFLCSFRPAQVVAAKHASALPCNASHKLRFS
eukprot:6195780-Pleurochrysis_carterae.AAC.2